MKFDIEDLQIDIDWLTGYGVDEKEAKDFILSLLLNKPDESLKNKPDESLKAEVQRYRKRKTKK